MKRKVTERDVSTAGSSEGATVGQLTSHIKNKLARSEVYGKLKHIKKVCGDMLPSLLGFAMALQQRAG